MNISQNPVVDRGEAVQQFDQNNKLMNRELEHTQVANIDQTPSFTSGDTCADTNDKRVWVGGDVSGFDKQQCTAQFASLEPGSPPLRDIT